ncbi:MAG: TlpA disulfide reductase family protein [Myxococcota bacterium]|nr:TlpA disulfide reductase family protein [Myxococcota bacterium]
MSRSILGVLDKPKGAAPLPLGFGDLLAVNILMQATSLGYLAALFRRDWFAPVHGMVSRLAYPVVTDWVALLVLGALLQRLTQLNERSDGTRMDRLAAAGSSVWLGYAFALIWIRIVFVLSHLPSTRSYFDFAEGVLGYLPAYRGVTELGRWRPEQWTVAVAFVVLSGLLGWLVSRRFGGGTRRLLLAVRISLAIALIVSAPAAWRAYASWTPAVAGDQLIDRLVVTPEIGGGDWHPAGLRGRVTLVEFWTTWCGACKRLLPGLSQLKRSVQDPRFELLLVNVEGRGQPHPELLKNIKKYQSDRAPELRVLVDRGAWADAVGITVYPTLALIGPQGRVVRLWSGTPDLQGVERAVRSALGSSL